MDQREHIEELLLRSDMQKKKSSAIQIAYEKYYTSGSDRDFENLISELDSYCISWVRKQLWKTGCYSDENEHTAMQEGRIAAWKVIEEDKKGDILRSDFAYYAFGVYKHKVLDQIRKYSAERKRIGTVSLDDPIGDSGQTYEEKLPPIQFDDETVRDEQRNLYEKIFLIYCQSFLESSTFPPRCLALYYARVLPHLLGAIPDGKATSAKWAFEYIGGRTVGELKDDSEIYLCNHVDRSLRWGDKFVQQLFGEISENGVSVILNNIVYTASYDKGKIEDWADYMHKVSTKASMNVLLKDAELLELAKEYISRSDTLYKFIERGNSR